MLNVSKSVDGISFLDRILACLISRTVMVYPPASLLYVIFRSLMAFLFVEVILDQLDCLLFVDFLGRRLRIFNHFLRIIRNGLDQTRRARLNRVIDRC